MEKNQEKCRILLKVCLELTSGEGVGGLGGKKSIGSVKLRSERSLERMLGLMGGVWDDFTGIALLFGERLLTGLLGFPLFFPFFQGICLCFVIMGL